jgi:F-type H+-transporting ATPase subunit a
MRAATDSPLSHVVQHPITVKEADGGLFTPEGVITLMSDHIAMMILGALLLVVLMPILVRKSRGSDKLNRLVPRGSANLIEVICAYFRDEIARPILHEHTDRFIKYIWSIFFFILTLNLLGLIPLSPISNLAGAHLGGTATANIWVTGTMAVLTMIMMVVNGLRIGGMDYVKHFNPGPAYLFPVMVPVEIIGLLAKGFALAVRLFANMVAGHILLAVLLSFVLNAFQAKGWQLGAPIAIPVVLGSVAITMLEIFVAFLQAFIFTFLTTLFIGQSVVFHHDDHAEPGEAAAH